MTDTARVSKSARTRQRILDAAAEVFRQQGYANARLSDIARRAGIKTGSLYYHFESREDLVAEILRLGIETAWEQVRAAVDGLPVGATAVDRLEAALRAHTAAVLEISDYASAQARIVGEVPPDVAAAHLVARRAYGEYWNDLLAGVRDEGRLRPGVDLFTVRMLAFGAMNWTSEWFSPERGSAAGVADQAVAMVLHGVVMPPAGR